MANGNAFPGARGAGALPATAAAARGSVEKIRHVGPPGQQPLHHTPLHALAPAVDDPNLGEGPARGVEILRHDRGDLRGSKRVQVQAVLDRNADYASRRAAGSSIAIGPSQTPSRRRTGCPRGLRPSSAAGTSNLRPTLWLRSRLHWRIEPVTLSSCTV